MARKKLTPEQLKEKLTEIADGINNHEDEIKSLMDDLETLGLRYPPAKTFYDELQRNGYPNWALASDIVKDALGELENKG